MHKAVAIIQFYNRSLKATMHWVYASRHEALEAADVLKKLNHIQGVKVHEGLAKGTLGATLAGDVDEMRVCGPCPKCRWSYIDDGTTNTPHR